MNTPPRNALAEVTVVSDSGSCVIGNRVTGNYVATPEIGGQVIRWLQAGLSPQECTERSRTMTGEPVDVADFLKVLTDEQILRPTDESSSTRHRGPRRSRQVGRVLFSRTASSGYAALTVAGGVLLVLRPTAADAVVGHSPLASVLVLSALTAALTIIHEMGHVLAAAREGLRCRLSVGRRLYFVTAEADLTRLWGLPRSRRYPPVLAGMALDAASVGGLLVVQAVVGTDLGGLPRDLVRAAVLVQVSALIFQTAVFARTDLYAVLAVASGCHQLWRTKTALLRRLTRTADVADLTALANAPHHQQVWARLLLLLYVPGLALAGWYLAQVSLPGLWRILTLAVSGIRTLDPHDPALYEGLLVVVAVAGPSLVALATALAAGARAARRGVIRPLQRS